MSNQKEATKVKSKKDQERPEKIQTAEGWKRKQAQALRERNPVEVKERKQRAV